MPHGYTDIDANTDTDIPISTPTTWPEGPAASKSMLVEVPLWQPISNTLSPSLEESTSLGQCRCAALSSTPYLQSLTPSLLRQHTSAYVSIRDV